MLKILSKEPNVKIWRCFNDSSGNALKSGKLNIIEIGVIHNSLSNYSDKRYISFEIPATISTDNSTINFYEFTQFAETLDKPILSMQSIKSELIKDHQHSIKYFNELMEVVFNVRD